MTKIAESGRVRPAPRLRYTEHINRRTTQSIYRAFDFAESQGCPLNIYAVIVLASADDQAADRDFRAIRHKYRDWMNHHNKTRAARVRPAYVYTFENPDGHTHVNWVLHVPDDLKQDFVGKLPKWLAKIRGKVNPFDINTQLVTDHPKSLAKYITKGTDPAYVKHFFLERVHAPQGWFRGLRAAVSTSLDKAARAANGLTTPRNASMAHARQATNRTPTGRPVQ